MLRVLTLHIPKIACSQVPVDLMLGTKTIIEGGLISKTAASAMTTVGG
jgi:hypothetical protein